MLKFNILFHFLPFFFFVYLKFVYLRIRSNDLTRLFLSPQL
ncbi:hypothetical protein MmiEs2_09520 [Methanimicrococcus stummii]|uniref:Uncharacterized protein n=1 Tax=Methanimicrococcus stummii TaxID=3028294 RepID=A0AA96V8J8_9EURY|nr:hypothetical protein MmiEs2_09520 [Methanimicrococcus sp. Es2]